MSLSETNQGENLETSPVPNKDDTINQSEIIDNKQIETEKKQTPEEILSDIEYHGESLKKYASWARVLLIEARNEGVSIDLSECEVLKKFADDGEISSQLYKIEQELSNIRTTIAKQGFRVGGYRVMEDLVEKHNS